MSVTSLFRARPISIVIAGLLAVGTAQASSSLADGYASLNGGTTGGEGGSTVYATTGTEINEAMCDRDSDDTSLIIYVTGTINHSNTTKVRGSCNTRADAIQFKGVSNISLIGTSSGATLDQIGVHIRDSSNIIIRNLTIKNVKKSGSPTSNGGDAIGIEKDVHNIWIDHNRLEASGGEDDGYDSLIDMKNNTKYVTVSYNYLYDSGRGGLIGHSDSDSTNTYITFHHNYYKDIDSRMPLLRFGTAHSYDNYFYNIAKSGMNPRIGGKIKAENNYFKDAQNPIGTFYTDDMGYWDISGNVFDNVTWLSNSTNHPAGPDPESTTSITIPYSYTLDKASCLPTLLPKLVGPSTSDAVSDGNCGVK
ncbi:MAG: Pectate trisaccharide-lyase [Candidatus Celerinatantimonas neptuna]|nr:MAG: Pectate trisaccharide-lyase [Candidatus Celerinatantimonas neptuna]